MSKDFPEPAAENDIKKLKKQCQSLDERIKKLERTIERWGPLVSKIEETAATVGNLRYRLMAALRR